MRVCFTSDLHGRAPLYDQLERLLAVDPPRLLILGGDLLPDGDADDPWPVQGRFVEESLFRWIDRWRRRQPGLEVACITGNHDWSFVETLLARGAERGLIYFFDHRAAVSIAGVRFLGYGKTPWTPYGVKDFERLDCVGDPPPTNGGAVWCERTRTSEAVEPAVHFTRNASIEAELAEAAWPEAPWIFVCHAPPFDTRLDRLPTVDHPIGSRAVRRFIAQRRPLCALHGHVHESPSVTHAYLDFVEEVPCINPGQGAETLHAVSFDTDDPVGTLQHTVLR